MTPNNNIRGFILVSTAIVLLVIIFPFLRGETQKENLQNKGYCETKGRYLTDSEIVDIGVTKFLEVLKREQSKLSEESKNPYFEFKNLEDFYNKNPFCCRRVVDPNYSTEIMTQNAIENGNGRISYSVSIVLEAGPNKFARTERTPSVSVCGVARLRSNWLKPSSASSLKPNPSTPKRP